MEHQGILNLSTELMDREYVYEAVEEEATRWVQSELVLIRCNGWDEVDTWLHQICVTSLVKLRAAPPGLQEEYLKLLQAGKPRRIAPAEHDCIYRLQELDMQLRQRFSVEHINGFDQLFYNSMGDMGKSLPGHAWLVPFIQRAWNRLHPVQMPQTHTVP